MKCNNQDNGAPAHTAKQLAQDWIATNCVNSLVSVASKLVWPQPFLDYHIWGSMLERYISTQAKLENIDKLKKVLTGLAAIGLD